MFSESPTTTARKYIGTRDKLLMPSRSDICCRILFDIITDENIRDELEKPNIIRLRTLGLSRENLLI